jgi:hypothetical protein
MSLELCKVIKSLLNLFDDSSDKGGFREAHDARNDLRAGQFENDRGIDGQPTSFFAKS